MNRRVVLVIASRFWPAGGAGATRVCKTVKYLCRCGWWPVVLTDTLRDGAVVPEVSGSVEDNDLPGDVPVVRVGAWTPADGIETLAPLIKRAARMTAHLGRGRDWWYGGLGWRAERWCERLSFPDRGIWRLGPALRSACALHRRWRFDAIFSSGMPFSDHLIALAVRTVLRRAWVAEFRDPWFEYVHAPQWCSGCGRRATRWAEQRVVAAARYVVSVSPAMSTRFARRYPRQPSRKFVSVYNGYDPDDFQVAVPPAGWFPAGRFVVLHAGSFYAARRPTTLLAAFGRFVSADPRRASRMALVMAGRLGPYAAEVAAAARSLPIHTAGVLPYRQVLGCMKHAAVNVLVLPGGRGTEGDVSTKVFEYLAAQRPILAAVPANGAAAAVLDGHGGVWRVEPDDEASMCRALEMMYALWRRGRLTVRRSEQSLTPLTRRYQTQRLARILDAAVGNARRRAARQKSGPSEPAIASGEAARAFIEARPAA